ncbi:ricin B-like lectin EULS3 [Durio zibethinus]|uniref:Ricin B-like lectin EULS3 n=1 Tax=Durio zibethinus TaxID=66656 RepID=A0A6P5WW12_DURZI|nr:ricin B-like lectin EULS3 [Durio zibethinus]
MEFPFGHGHSHTDHHHRNDDQENQERLAAPHHQHHEFDPPRSHVINVHHSGGGSQQPELSSFNCSQHVTHVAHESSQESFDDHHQSKGHHCLRPHTPSFTDHLQSYSGSASQLYEKRTPWVKDEKFFTKAKDEEGLPSFALVNKVTSQAIKPSIGATHPVLLIPYKPYDPDESMLWSESMDNGDGYRAVRFVGHIPLNLDVFLGDGESDGVHNDTTIGLSPSTWEITMEDCTLCKSLKNKKVRIQNIVPYT